MEFLLTGLKFNSAHVRLTFLRDGNIAKIRAKFRFVYKYDVTKRTHLMCRVLKSGSHLPKKLFLFASMIALQK